MADPLVSVLVPAYRAAPYIGECLRSIMAQTYTELELIVVEDCSPDNTFDVALATVGDWPRATVLRNETNIGNKGNFQRLLGMGRGSLIKFVCDDDVLEPHAVARLVGALASDPRTSLATSWRTPIDGKGAPMPLTTVPQPPVNGDAILDGRAAGNHVLRHLRNWIGEPTTVLFRRGLLSSNGLYSLGTSTPGRNLDVVWWLKLLSQGALAVVGEALSRFRLHPGQVTQQANRSELVLSWYDIIQGAVSQGYLTDPSDEAAAWSSMVGLLQAHIDTLDQDGRTRALKISESMAARLSQLSAA